MQIFQNKIKYQKQGGYLVFSTRGNSYEDKYQVIRDEKRKEEEKKRG